MATAYTKNVKYSYDGPVLEFDRIVANRWTSTTYAPSEKKAHCNLAYQFKKQFNKNTTAKITLPGKVVQLGGEEQIS